MSKSTEITGERDTLSEEWEKEVEKAFSMHFKKDHHQNKLSVLKGIVSKALSKERAEMRSEVGKILMLNNSDEVYKAITDLYADLLGNKE